MCYIVASAALKLLSGDDATIGGDALGAMPSRDHHESSRSAVPESTLIEPRNGTRLRRARHRAGKPNRVVGIVSSVELSECRCACGCDRVALRAACGTVALFVSPPSVEVREFGACFGGQLVGFDPSG
jgi:hypothetical protein